MGSAPTTHHNIVVLESVFSPVPEFKLPNGLTHTLTSYPRTQPTEVAERIKNATILITTTIALPAEVLSENVSPHLQFIAVMAVGTDTINLDACRKRGIQVCNSVNANASSVSEHAIGLYFAARRKLIETHVALRANEWPRRGTLMNMLEDKTGTMPLTCEEEVMGLIGYGFIGKKIGHIARMLGMKVLVADRRGAKTIREGYTSFEEVLKQSSVVVLIIPRTPDSINLISTSELKVMRPQAVLVNVSRGGIVDEAALVQALRENWIAGAAVDVYATEPAGPETSPLATEDTKDLNLTLSPHSAWVSDTTMQNLQRMVGENVEGFCAGKLPAAHIVV
ncbi:glycerate dehydrogenase [Mytilinidion resinicola]|uniref:Glycerate dehydrogenase n=1 Tax=Mytilinidion resinicola TaxID=574789 RepID=A0A6A6Y5L3_9PEZI|nr:glycerate dehydrogenase [Mytilinidion resinicola]KAF2804082.1 glycerate dehydrogenase [Mytilinidion resinicola]